MSGSEAPAAAPRRSGRVFILSAPSGAGKTTLRQAVLTRFGDIHFSVSFTTRPRRPGEQDGRDYVFISREEFEAGIAAGRWAEWARVHGNYYGTAAGDLLRILASGRDVLLEIDVQGARQILSRFPDSVTIFIAPPSPDVLRQRLIARGTDDPQAVALRLANAEHEMSQSGYYRHVIVNDDLDTATRELTALIARYRAAAATMA
jgi:guanylate kinase